MKEKKSNSLIEMKDLQFLWRMVKKNIILLISLPILFYAVGYVYTYRLTDIYGAKMQLLLKQQDTYDYQDPIYKGLGAYGAYMDVRNQIRILQSRDIIEEVVDRMDANTSYFIKGRLKKKEVFGTLPFNATADLFNPAGIHENPIDIYVVDEESYRGSYVLNEIEHQFEGKFEEYAVTQDFSLLLSRNYEFHSENIDRVINSDYQIVFHSNDYMIRHFQSALNVENLEYTSILEVGLTDDIGMRAKVFLDTLAAVFVNYSQQSQLEINQNTLENIEKQIAEVQKILIKIEKQLLKYKKDNDIIELTKEEETYFKQYVTFTEDERELNYMLSSVRLLENYIRTSEDERLLPPSFYVLKDDEYLRSQVNEFYNLQLSISDKVYNVSEDHPAVDKMRDELIQKRKDLLTYIKNLKLAIESQINENSKLINRYKKEVQDIPISSQGVDNIRRELDVNNKMYLFLLEKKTNTLIARAGIIPQVQIVEKAVSQGVIGPEKDKLKNLFLLAGIVAGLFFAFIRKIFFERIENASELADLTKFSVIGGIPFVKDVENPVVVEENPKAHVTESFRTLRSNLSFLGKTEIEGRATIITISSFFPGEGKTFCSVNLATILARSDKKVIIVDFDMHKPKVHKTLGIPNDKGISNFLSKKMDFKEVVQSNRVENLDIITCGPIPPNPSELILKKEVEDLVKDLSTKYDYVILDTPPFGLLNDSIELSKISDVFITVLNTKFASNRGLKTIENILDKNQDVSVGLVLNGIKQSKLRYYYSKYTYKYSYRYSYGSGYGYGYGYGQNYGENEEN